MLGAVAAGRDDMSSAMLAMSRLTHEIEPAGGGIAALHEKRRHVFDLIQDSERRARLLMQM